MSGKVENRLGEMEEVEGWTYGGVGSWMSGDSGRGREVRVRDWDGGGGGAVPGSLGRKKMGVGGRKA